MQKKSLHAFYDIQVNAASFDICKFIVLAEQQRRLNDLESVHTYIVPNGEDWARSDDEHSEMQQKWRLRNILIPALSTMPSFIGFTVCTSRSEAMILEREIDGSVFPTGYTVNDPVPCFEWADIAVNAHHEIPSITANPQALRYVKKWLNTNCNNLKPVSITMREMSLEKHRNSNVEAWLKFANELPEKGFFPIILRDTALALEVPDEIFDGLTLFNEATLNLELRAALYQLSYINAFVANGPAELCLFNTKVNYLYFLKLYGQDGKKIYEVPDYALPHRGRFPVEGPHQLMVWDDDSYDAILTHFNRMTLKLEAEKEQIELFKSKDHFPPSSISPIIYLELLTKAKRARNVDELALRLEKKQMIRPDQSYFYRGSARLTKGDKKATTDLFLKAIEINNSEPKYFRELGVFYLSNGDITGAVDCFEKGLALTTGEPDLISLVCICVGYYNIGKFDQAEKIALDCIDKGIQHLALYETLSDINKMRGNLKLAAKFLITGHTI
jgi:hypothetical protein